MTLVQATAEAVERHYRVRDPLPAATALAAYLGARGAGTRVTPGISDGEPVFTSRLEALARSVERGRRLFAARCRACHADADAGSLVEGFPRMREAGAQSLEAFLEGHSAADAALTWDGAPMADLVAYLVSHRAGRPFEGAAGPAPTPAP
jgi:mono/diheme cytochrome c family protein